MSHGVSPVSLKDVPAIVGAEPFRLPMIWKGLAVAFIVLGMAVFAFQVFAGDDAKHLWLAIHVNFVFWFGLAAASTVFSAVFQICNAQWSRPIRRLFESASTFFFYCPVLLLILYFFKSYEHLFVWVHEPAPGKEGWLTPNFVYVRDIFAMIVLVALGRRVVHYSIRQDVGAVRSGLTGLPKESLTRWHDKEYDRYVGDWGADAKNELVKTSNSLSRLSPVVVAAYAVVMSLVAFDLVMSVDPHWYSTLFGAFIFMSAGYLALAWCSMLVAIARVSHPLFTQKIERRTLHDLGKLLFGFGIFWAYLMWSHYLPIWYGNMPEETGYMILRLRDKPWHDFAWLVLTFCFILPFLLGLSRDVKQVPALLFCTGMIAACGLWLMLYLLITPSLYRSVIPFNLTEVSVTLAFFGGFLLSSASFLEKAPLMPFGDLYVFDRIQPKQA